MWIRAALTLVIGAGVACAQLRALRNIATPVRSAGISITSIRFQDLRWGHEGADYFSTRRPPQRGAQEIAQARIYGQEAIAAIRFEMIDEAGQPLGAVPAVRTSTGVDDGDYVLRVPVPARSFRFRVIGQDVSGKPFSRLHATIFRPVDQGPPGLPAIAGMTAEQAAQLQKALEAARAEMNARFDAGEGWIRIPRTEVVEAGYEPFAGASGHVIGMRLHLSVRFGAAGSYTVRPHVFPLYANTAWRGTVEMKAQDGQVDPAPENRAADALADVIRYGGAAQYEGGVVYRFSFDLVPQYVIRNRAGTRYCLYLEQFRAGNRLGLWNAIAGSAAPVRYRVDLSGLGFHADTEPMTPQRVFYESFLSEGAADCGPEPNVNF
jgi:hypothetical protein